MYDDALIIKLFAFQFVNSYTSCFYIAFFRGVNTISTFILYSVLLYKTFSKISIIFHMLFKTISWHNF